MENGVKIKSLTNRQELFCIEYVLNKGNASEAARRAGYSEDSDEQQGYENLRKPYIIARIAELREESGVKTGANIQWLESMLVTAIERCAQKQQVYDKNGDPTGIFAFDAKGLASNASVLIKLNAWGEKPPESKPETDAEREYRIEQRMREIEEGKFDA